jgi:N-acetylglucosaminyldiphosphoundecaprenol N-acetyl-beta-D-mannosaminyltransferase
MICPALAGPPAADVRFGIGAAFAFHAGEVRQSPPVRRKPGLEWACRATYAVA